MSVRLLEVEPDEATVLHLYGQYFHDPQSARAHLAGALECRLVWQQDADGRMTWWPISLLGWEGEKGWRWTEFAVLARARGGEVVGYVVR